MCLYDGLALHRMRKKIHSKTTTGVFFGSREENLGSIPSFAVKTKKKEMKSCLFLSVVFSFVDAIDRLLFLSELKGLVFRVHHQSPGYTLIMQGKDDCILLLLFSLFSLKKETDERVRKET
jgi:hypothetical protein